MTGVIAVAPKVRIEVEGAVPTGVVDSVVGKLVHGLPRCVVLREGTARCRRSRWGLREGTTGHAKGVEQAVRAKIAAMTLPAGTEVACGGVVRARFAPEKYTSEAGWALGPKQTCVLVYVEAMGQLTRMVFVSAEPGGSVHAGR